MKHALCLLLTFCLCLGLCGCSKDPSLPPHSEATTQTVSTNEPTTIPEASPPTVPETAPPTVPETAPPTVPETVPAVTEPVQIGPTPLLYRVTDAAGNEIWLFGSIHVGIDAMYPLPQYVMDAYETADALAVECDVIAAQNDMDAMMDMLMPMIYMDGTTISDHIPQEVYTAAVAILKDQGYYNQLLDYYMPVLWYSFIESFTYMDFGYDPEAGIDMFLLTDAKASGKPIAEVESVTFQYSMLASFSEELQVLLLQEAVEAYGSQEGKEELDGLLQAWCEGDEARLLAYLDAEMDTADYDEATALLIEEFYTAMSTNRNISMAQYAAEALASGEKLFICVGMAHILGDGAMVDLLLQQGYTVERVQ